jgi:hypothetical protein
MTESQYLQQVLQSQTLAGGCSEIKKLQKHRKDVEDLIRGKFNSPLPTIRYGGLKA